MEGGLEGDFENASFYLVIHGIDKFNDSEG